MVFEFNSGSGFDYIQKFADETNSAIHNNSLQIPTSIGNGFIKRIDIGHGFRILIHKYNMNESFIIKRMASDDKSDILTFRFINHISSDRSYLSNVQVLNNRISIDDYLQPNETVYYIIIAIEKDKLLALTELNPDSEAVISFFDATSGPFLYQENLTFEMKNVMRELSELQDHANLEKLYYKARVMDLLYLFFSRFFKRSVGGKFSANRQDIEKVIAIEKSMMQDLSVQPNLSELSRNMGMSSTKMKELFRNIFGDSIYNYYQHARMSEAASLLKNNKDLSVSDIGYSLGFSNMSHFSKMFKKHIGVNPKEYAINS